ncbi:hypothetical protein SESBI_12508 [Sesbania bispinosa]|nr:hypothetical protein SESBI_12508 [Sesbania bispinosa]
MASNSEKETDWKWGVKIVSAIGQGSQWCEMSMQNESCDPVSGTDANPGRLFYSCPKMRVNEMWLLYVLDNESVAEDIIV